MSTIFIAVQCFQCSTMQVKQQKKSSNKWSCVICNEKQSVRKIFCRGFLAKDVRKFVQSFNMKRQFDAEATSIPASNSEIQEIPTEESSHRKRSDWTEYLDSPVEKEGGGLEESALEHEIEIVTEIPKEMFEKRRTGGRKRLFEPPFSKRKERPRSPQGDRELENCLSKRTRQVSKWSRYLEEEDGGLTERDREPPNHYKLWSGEGVLESHYNDQRVEEDIHPDFAS